MVERRRDEDPTSEARAARAGRRRRDLERVLPLLGVFLLVSPLTDVFVGGGSLGGIPVGSVYVFGVWFALIAATAVLAAGSGRDGGGG